MNFSMVFFVLRIVLQLEALFLIPPLLISSFQGETRAVFGFVLTILLILPLCFFNRRKPRKGDFSAREGFVVVGLAWIVLSLFGALPFFLSGAIPNFIDCLFETISGFTTTGASILTNVEALPMGLLFWRSFTHWIGGMGVLVFMLAVIPLAENSGGSSMHLLRAESPGPQVGKIKPKILDTAKFLYAIYIVLTAVEVPFLLAGGMDLFESVTTAFATAGTGGFFIKTTSLIGYSTYIQVVLTVFMLLFGVNFNVYALLLVRKFSAALMDEELKVYLGTFLFSTAAITLNLVLSMGDSIGGALQSAAFHVSSIMTTTGFVAADFDLWPGLSKLILLLLMVFGACAGSTGGGVKIARIILLFKTAKNYLVKMFRPRLVRHVHLNGKVVEHETTHGVLVFMVFYAIICVVSMLVVSLENHSFDTTLSAVFACINNVGPGLGVVGPTSSFAELSYLSKIVLSFDMLFGRLEIYPMLLLFVPAVWKRK